MVVVSVFTLAYKLLIRPIFSDKYVKLCGLFCFWAYFFKSKSLHLNIQTRKSLDPLFNGIQLNSLYFLKLFFWRNNNAW